MKIAPLSGSFLLIGLFAFFFGLLYVVPLSTSIGAAITFFGAIVIIASVISTTHGPVEEELALDEHVSDRKKRVRIIGRREYLKMKK